MRRPVADDLAGASSFRSFRGEAKKPAVVRRARSSRRVRPDKGELSPR
ncbi:MAG: hypothetical protein JOY81_04995 [Alphaproteobacteria bacterium]|nr:hypothetical protein [Alphaproteobacteria bacterium]